MRSIARSRRFKRLKRSKARQRLLHACVRKSIAIFGGAEHMLAGAPLISPLSSKIDFPSLLRSMSMLRSRCYKRIECWVAIPSDQYWSDRCWRFYFNFLRLHFYPRLFALPSSLFFCLSLLAAFPEEKINARQPRAKSCAR